MELVAPIVSGTPDYRRGMPDFPAYCARCDSVEPHDSPPGTFASGAIAAPICMTCATGGRFRATYAPLTPAARKRIRGMRPEDAQRLRRDNEMRDSSFGVWAIVGVLALGGLAALIAVLSR